ncbi:hypothetical protein GCM10027515_04590 [Schumannella luteola]|uniref:Uncharacterized protein n=1 Tax=Schumannella luteola TaxID=472059 RepID=A0A852YME9_9MICO|nr:hypothetical protein [Schumannella luteola]NYG98405.1 hypothetical protein [Schumannella luteola]TPX01357.1 hypothetical protein FJ656_28660 [Schumannella luteola]
MYEGILDGGEYVAVDDDLFITAMSIGRQLRRVAFATGRAGELERNLIEHELVELAAATGATLRDEE